MNQEITMLDRPVFFVLQVVSVYILGSLILRALLQ